MMKRESILEQQFCVLSETMHTTRPGAAVPVSYEIGMEFCAVGQANSYHVGFDYNSGQRLLIVAARGAETEDAARQGPIIQLGEDVHQDAAYQRAILIERAQLGGLPLEDSIRLTDAITDYDCLDEALNAPEKPLGARTTGPRMALFA